MLRLLKYYKFAYMINLNNKIIAVTGGSGLLGSAMIKEIKLMGGTAINLDVSFKTNLENNEIYCDITSYQSIKYCLEELFKKFNKIDGWINNAYPRTSDWGAKIEDIVPESWEKNISMHLNGYFFCCQQVLEIMKKQKSGSIVNMASIYGMVGPDFTIYEGTSMTTPAAYASIKGGIITQTKYLASYYGKYNIRVNSVSPGGIWDKQPEAFVKNYEKKVPLKRMGKPEDIAPSIAFLMSDSASYITGHNLAIDGGWTCI